MRNNELFLYNLINSNEIISKHIENLDIPLINPFYAAFVDYSKTEANNALENIGIKTSKSILISNIKTALEFGKKLRFPKVVKMETGGKARNVYLVKSYSEYKRIVSKLVSVPPSHR